MFGDDNSGEDDAEPGRIHTGESGATPAPRKSGHAGSDGFRYFRHYTIPTTPVRESSERSARRAVRSDHAVQPGASCWMCSRSAMAPARRLVAFCYANHAGEGISVNRPSGALSTYALIIIGLASVTACAESHDVQHPTPSSAVTSTTSTAPTTSAAPSPGSSRPEPPRLPDTEPVAPPPALEPETGEPAVPEPPQEMEAPERPAPTLPEPGFAPRPGY